MKKIIIFTAFLFMATSSPSLAATGCDGSGNCYVRAGASGTGSGADWTNAYSSFGSGSGQINPSSMARGVTYFVAGGNYSIGSIITFNTPDSGTTPITLQASTIASHGTNTGWSNSYQAQAVWSAWYVESDYWIFNGSYRGSGTGVPATDWRSGYGFKINNNNGSNIPIGTACVWLGPATYPTANNVTIQYIECAGSGDTTGSHFDEGIWASQSQNTFVEYNYVHDTGNCSFVDDHLAPSTTTVEYNWFMNDQSTPAQHGEGVNLRGSGNYTVAFNFIENEEGTGYIGTPCPGASCFNGNNTWLIYGNVFFADLSEWHGNNVSNGGVQTGLSYAYIQYFNGTWQEIALWNNTIYQLSPGTSGSSNDCDGLNGGNATVTNFYFQNNLIVNCTASILGAPTSGTLTRDHNSYFSVASVSDTGTGVQSVSSMIPFVNASAHNFSLSLDTSSWLSLSAPYNVDILGTTRTSSRGAFQYLSGNPGPTPAPTPSPTPSSGPTTTIISPVNGALVP